MQCDGLRHLASRTICPFNSIRSTVDLGRGGTDLGMAMLGLGSSTSLLLTRSKLRMVSRLAMVTCSLVGTTSKNGHCMESTPRGVHLTT